MTTSLRQLANRLLLAATATALASTAHADFTIGQTAGHTGQVAASVGEATKGAKLYFDIVNAGGGINGQKINLVSLDDKFDPKIAAANAKQLIDQGVISLFLNRGTPHTQAIMPLLTEHKVPLVGPSTGAMVLHKPVHPWLFNVRATYQREAERAIEHLSLIGMERIAIVQVDDSFGDDAVQGAMAGLTKTNKKPIAHEKYDRAKPDFAPIVPKLLEKQPQAVMFIGSGTAVVAGMKAVRAAGSTAQLVTLSNNASMGFIKDLGDIAYGVIVSQVFPYERSIAKPIIKEISEAAQKAGVDLTPTVVEGYVSAKVLVEGLKRAGKTPTRQSLRDALEGMGRFDVGGIEVGYGPKDHSGLDYVDLAIIDQNGKFRR
ncbi:ABC-type branched-subunit amino acid transport system substrate-binding protein [Pelomonas saccharophila]|uniref:ABC-type branched-subunit amino acid transport system substrate-binding protein n=1 Tax=Roseateles saccharophilus TaxID=304 RepID=A0ABU1YHJ9_ROSSA|nr:ABC transporter substrate-binding protein [Roseateles saccharophilus]MDR7267710.1 ABC-type branched-subunit amino acid transport system substrate-binding protein [Roseateles saccharophilus]